MKLISIIVIFFTTFSGLVEAQSKWITDKNIAYTPSIMQGKNGPVYTTLLIEFNPALGCTPEIALLVTTEQNLGRTQRHEWMKSQMSIQVDSHSPWSARTAFTKYENGMETTFLGDKTILNRLKSGSEAIVSPIPNSTRFSMPLKGSSDSINRANLYCQNSR